MAMKNQMVLTNTTCGIPTVQSDYLTVFLRQFWGSPHVRFRASEIAVTKLEAVKPLVSRSRVPFNRSTWKEKELEIWCKVYETQGMVGCNIKLW